MSSRAVRRVSRRLKPNSYAECVNIYYTVDTLINKYKVVGIDYQRDEHRVHLIVYHLIWTPKRRKAVLTGAIATDCTALIEAPCTEKGWEIIELAVQPDHVHLFVRAWPSDSASDVVKACKGRTSHELRAKHPVLTRLPSLWTRSFFAATAGNVSSETIARYIEAQKGR